MMVWPVDAVLRVRRARAASRETRGDPVSTDSQDKKVEQDLLEEREFRARRALMDRPVSGAILEMEPDPWDSTSQGTVNKQQCRCVHKEQRRCGMDIR